MSDLEASQGARRWSNSESGSSRLNSTSFEDELFVDNADLSFNQNNLCHQSQLIIPHGLPEGFIEFPMGVGTGTRLQARKLPANNEQQAFIESKLEIIRTNIATWQRDIDKEPNTFEGINTQYVSLQGSIHSL